MSLVRSSYPLIFLVLTQLVSCGSNPSRYRLQQDVAPVGKFDASKVPDVIPKWEPLSIQGNQSPYRVLGKEYRVLQNINGFEQEGIASWYGLKFHGELTSNGEIYNMYNLSAAHKTLPLPTYLRVTNLENQKSIIVRVNDRGPFHSDRIIDLSYAAAKKLAYQKKGTARVKLEAISVDNPNETASGLGQPDQLVRFIQVGAFSKLESAELTKEKVQALHSNNDVFIAESLKQNSAIYRVRIGPFLNLKIANDALDKINRAEIGDAILITRSIKAKNL